MTQQSLGVITELFPQGGYGFVATEDGREVYFHAHVVSGEAFTALRIGDTVYLDVQETPGDQHPHAICVRREHDASPPHAHDTADTSNHVNNRRQA